jgi:zinc transporter, ZIP family
MLPIWLQAALWGFLAGSALLLGAAIGYFLRVPQRLIAAIMAFGSGVLISALAFELMDDAFRRAGFAASALGFLAGALLFTTANWILERRGARHRKRSRAQATDPQRLEGGSLPIALGALIDGVPESIAIGTSVLAGGKVSLVTVAAIFISNVPEGLSSAAGMRLAHRPVSYVFGVWGAVALLTGLWAWAGYAFFAHHSLILAAATTAVAAGAILAMLVDTMIPEAFEAAHSFAGLITALGFLVSFMLSKLVG